MLNIFENYLMPFDFSKKYKLLDIFKIGIMNCSLIIVPSFTLLGLLYFSLGVQSFTSEIAIKILLYGLFLVVISFVISLTLATVVICLQVVACNIFSDAHLKKLVKENFYTPFKSVKFLTIPSQQENDLWEGKINVKGFQIISVNDDLIVLKNKAFRFREKTIQIWKTKENEYHEVTITVQPTNKFLIDDGGKSLQIISTLSKYFTIKEVV